MGPDRTRPPGIWIIVGLQLVITALWVGDLALRTELSGDGFQALVASSDVLRALLIAWAGGVVLASILLIRLSRRGWLAGCNRSRPTRSRNAAAVASALRPAVRVGITTSTNTTFATSQHARTATNAFRSARGRARNA